MENIYNGKLNQDHIYKQSFRLSAIGCTRFRVADLVWYLQIMQEISLTHSEQLNLGVSMLNEKGYEWVILRNIVNIYRYANWGETVHLETWAHQKYKLYFPRTIIGYDDDGNKLFESTSYWALLNRKRNFRPIPPKPYLDIYGYPEDQELSKVPDYPEKIIINENNILANTRCTKSKYEDIDINLHTNNITYVKWMKSLMDDEYRNTHKVSFIDVSWMQQTYISDNNEVKLFSDFENNDYKVFKYAIEKEDIDGIKTISSIATMKWCESNILV